MVMGMLEPCENGSAECDWWSGPVLTLLMDELDSVLERAEFAEVAKDM